MRSVEVSDETYSHVEHFRAVINAVMDEELDTQACFGLILEQGLRSMLLDIMGPQEHEVLLESFQQLAATNPAAVYQYVASILKAGAKLRERELRRSRIGFSTPE